MAFLLLLLLLLIAVGGRGLASSVTFTSTTGITIRIVVGVLLVTLGLIQAEVLPFRSTPLRGSSGLVTQALARCRHQHPVAGFAALGFSSSQPDSDARRRNDVTSSPKMTSTAPGSANFRALLRSPIDKPGNGGWLGFSRIKLDPSLSPRPVGDGRGSEPIATLGGRAVSDPMWLRSPRSAIIRCWSRVGSCPFDLLG